MAAGGNPDIGYGGEEGLERLNSFLGEDAPEVVAPPVLNEEEKVAAEELRKSAEKMEKERAELLADKKKFGEILRNASNSEEQIANTPAFGPSRSSAREKLTELQFNVDYLAGLDPEGNPEVVGADLDERLNEVQEVARELINGSEISDIDRARRVLETIRVDEKIIEEWVPINRIENLIQDNEDLYRELFFADFDQDVWEQNEVRIAELWSIFLDEEILEQIANSGFQYNSNPEGYFALLREAYMQHIFGEEVLSGLNDAKEDLDKTIATSKSKNSRDKTVAENLLRTQRPRVENLIRGKTLGVGSSRGWPSVGSGIAADYMLEYFGLKEKNGGSDYDVIVKLFKTKYLLNKVDLDPTEIQKMNLATETMKTIQAVEKVHNWTKALEGAASFEKLNTTEMSGIDEAIKTVFNINGGDMIANVMEIYISEMASEARSDVTVGVDIDNAAVLTKVLQRMDSQTFKTDEEKTLFATMARDLIRVTGMDAQFFMPRNGIEDKDKPLKLIKGGSFLAGAINFEEKTKKKYAEDKGLLVSGLDFGLTPFFRTLWKQSDTKCEGFSAEDIDRTFRLKFVGTEYTSWINSFDGIVNLQKGEEDFIKNPSIKGFVETVIPLYLKAKVDGEKIKERFTDVIKGLVVSRFTDYVGISTYLSAYLIREDGSFNNLGIFKDTKEAKKYFANNSRGVNLAKYEGRQDNLTGRALGRKITNFFTLKGWRE